MTTNEISDLVRQIEWWFEDLDGGVIFRTFIKGVLIASIALGGIIVLCGLLTGAY